MRIAYDHLPERMISEFGQYADFDRQQSDWIENAVYSFHTWHRQQELPRYSNLLRVLAENIGNKIPPSDFPANFLTQLEARIRAVQQCNPVSRGILQLKSLDDEQINQVRTRMQTHLAEDRQEYSAMTRDERIEHRFKKIVSLFARMDLDLNQQQQDRLRQTLQKQPSLGIERFKLREQWQYEFLYLLQHRDNTTFEADMNNHLNRLWTLSETRYPQVWNKMREIWRGFFGYLLESLEQRQRQNFSAWLVTMSETLDTLAKEKTDKDFRMSLAYEECRLI